MQATYGKGSVLSTSRVSLLLVALVIFETAVLLLPGRILIDAHEVDVLHAVNAVLRMSEGERPHIDFVTPLGPMAFYPMAWLVQAGSGVAQAFMLVNVALAALLVPALVRIADSRLTGGAGLAFGAVVIVFATALVFGGTQANVSVSMSYNRWAWAVGLVVLVLALVDPKTERPGLDGAMIGVGLAYLALLKVTFFVGFAPVILLALFLRGAQKALIVALGAGVTCAVIAVVVFGGMNFVRGYVADLLFVLGAEVRPRPGLPWHSLLGAPLYLPGILCHLALIVVCRVSGASREGLLLLTLLPVFGFVTYQNWGNDPKWLVFLGFFALAVGRIAGLQPIFGHAARRLCSFLAVACFALSAPVLANMALSPIRNLVASPDGYVPMLAAQRHTGLRIGIERSVKPAGDMALPQIDDLADMQGSLPEAQLAGETFRRCAMTRGYFGKMLTISRRLEALGLAEKRVLFADVTNPIWLIGPFARVPGEAPWYYGGTPDMAGIDVVVVPTCGTSELTHDAYLGALSEAANWRVLARDPHFVLFAGQ